MDANVSVMQVHHILYEAAGGLHSSLTGSVWTRM